MTWKKIFHQFWFSAQVQKCIHDKFRKESNFLENLNEQVKRKESLSLSGAKKISQDTQMNGSNPLRGKKKVYWILLTVCFLTLLMIVGVTVYTRWRRQLARMLLLQGSQYKDVSYKTILNVSSFIWRLFAIRMTNK